MGMESSFLNRKSDLSVRKGVLLYKQLIRPMMVYACPAWRSAARTHVQRVHVLQSKCLRLVTGAPLYVINRQIHEDVGVPLFADHIRALTTSFQSKLADLGNSLARQLGRYADRRLSPSSDAKAKDGRGQQTSRGHRPPWSIRLKNRTQRWSAERLSATLTEVFPWFFSQANARVYDAKSGHGPHSPRGAATSPKRLEKSRIPPVCGRANLGSEPRQPTKQSLSLP